MVSIRSILSYRPICATNSNKCSLCVVLGMRTTPGQRRLCSVKSIQTFTAMWTGHFPRILTHSMETPQHQPIHTDPLYRICVHRIRRQNINTNFKRCTTAIQISHSNHLPFSSSFSASASSNRKRKHHVTGGRLFPKRSSRKWTKLWPHPPQPSPHLPPPPAEYGLRCFDPTPPRGFSAVRVGKRGMRV